MPPTVDLPDDQAIDGDWKKKGHKDQGGLLEQSAGRARETLILAGRCAGGQFFRVPV